jgi:hypothetical protein
VAISILEAVSSIQDSVDHEYVVRVSLRHIQVVGGIFVLPWLRVSSYALGSETDGEWFRDLM